MAAACTVVVNDRPWREDGYETNRRVNGSWRIRRAQRSTADVAIWRLGARQRTAKVSTAPTSVLLALAFQGHSEDLQKVTGHRPEARRLAGGDHEHAPLTAVELQCAGALGRSRASCVRPG